MNEPVTQAEIDALLVAAGVATARPWQSDPEADLAKAGVYAGEDETIICDVTDEDTGRPERDANAAYIVLAANLAPRLVLDLVAARFNLASTYCAFCGHATPVDDATAEKITAHVMECPKHPLRAMVEEAKGLREKVDELECTLDDEEAAHRDTWRLWDLDKAEMKRLDEALGRALAALK